MASQVFNRFKEQVALANIDLVTDTLQIALVDTTTTVDTENTGINYVADFTTLGELTDASYSRKTLTTKAVNRDDANSRAEFDADDVTWTALAGGETIQGILLYKFVTNDTDSEVVAYIELPSTIVTNGSDFTIQWNTEGILQLA